MAENLSLMEQHNNQQAVLISMGDAPMASSAGAVVALSVDLSVGVGGVPCSEPVDDCAEKCFGPELSSTVIPPDDISSDASDADILPNGVTTPTVPHRHQASSISAIPRVADAVPSPILVDSSKPLNMFAATFACFPTDDNTRLPATPST